jgi:signal transduction histidine kinase/ActR/RegA family two-component response regulator
MTDTREIEQFARVMAARPSRLPVRLGLAALIALPLAPLMGLEIVGPWYIAYAVLQGIERAIFNPARLAQLATSSRLQRLASVLSVLQGSMIGVYGMLVLAYGPPRSLNLAMVVAVAVMMTNVTSSRASRWALLAGVGPQTVFLVCVLPVMVVLNGSEPPVQALIFAVGGLVCTVTAALAWREYARLLWSEATALAEAEIRRAEAESATAAKSAFVAMVSHELRTPISAIQAGAAALESQLVEPSQRDQTGLIIEAGRMMRALLDDLLDLSKLEAGRMTVEVAPFDVRALVRNTAKFWRAEARKKGIQLTLSGTRKLPQWVGGDPTRIRQVLNNLLSNALKFTPEGVVALRIALPNEAGIAFSVDDSGGGMSGEQLSRLFKPFSQADETVTRTHGGTGLGLSISRDLAHAMGGELAVKSTLGAGSVFTLSLPLQAAEAPAAARTALEPLIGASSAPRILAVDDHELNRRTMTLVLQTIGADLALASGGNEALERLALEAFDVVLLDVHMADLGGVEVARRLRGQAGPNRATPIIAVTGAIEEGDKALYLAVGMNDCVAKPIEIAELYAALQRVLATSTEENLRIAL